VNKQLQYFILFQITLLCICNKSIRAQNFYFGNDLSYIREMEDCGAGYTENGLAKDPYAIIKEHGGNLVRLRLWHTPSWYDMLNLGNRYSDINDVILSSYSAKSLGMQVLLDFQLSDTWADPTHQVVPAAWASVVNNLPVLQDSLYNYIHATLILLHQTGLLPEIVQIGNETNKGILLSQQVNDQGWSVNWTRNAALFNTAIEAVRDVETETGSVIKIALHIADPSELDWWYDQFWSHGVQDFDIIGMSYYYQYHQDLIPAVGEVISNMKNTYPGKAVMILETAYPWTSAFADGANNLLNSVYPGYPFSPENQQRWLNDLTQTVIDHGGSGVIYWEPGWVSTDCFTRYGKGSNWENSTFFDFDDTLLEEGGIGWMSHTYDFSSGITEAGNDTSSFRIIQVDGEIWIINNISKGISEQLQIEVYEIGGKRIWSVEVIEDSGIAKMKTKSLPVGVYYFRIKTASGERANQLLLLH
jgi:arabinogalactan endo-1,4-beta-galactosidase